MMLKQTLLAGAIALGLAVPAHALDKRQLPSTMPTDIAQWYDLHWKCVYSVVPTDDEREQSALPTRNWRGNLWPAVTASTDTEMWACPARTRSIATSARRYGEPSPARRIIRRVTI